jgi:N-acetylglucosamine kinase-like BadF-type ATPase
MTAAVLAVDGGNSKTDVVLLDATGRLLGRARGESTNHQMIGVDAAMEELDRVIALAARHAGLDDGVRPLAEHGAYCLAGHDLPADERLLGQAVDQRGWSAHHFVCNDTFAVARAGFQGSWGVGLVCGTGLNCAGIGPDGARVRFASLGELSGDFTPGGAWLGVRALGLALRAGDGRGAPTLLTRRVPDHLGQPDAEAVLGAVYGGALPYHRLFELAEVLLDCAADGDRPARRAADQLADEIVVMITATIERLGAAGTPVEVVLGGGIFDTRDTAFMDRVADGVRAVAPQAVLRRLGAPPVVGAALLGLDLGGAGPAAAAMARAALSSVDG